VLLLPLVYLTHSFLSDRPPFLLARSCTRKLSEIISADSPKVGQLEKGRKKVKVDWLPEFTWKTAVKTVVGG